MMATTHAAVGLTLVVPLVWVAPELAAVAAIGALAGGVFPDVDLFVGVHRKTLHFPVYYTLAAGLVGLVAVVTPTALTVALAFFFLSAGLHSITDWFGAGDELRPWNRTSDRAVYVHPAKRWLRPRYLVRYDGAPEDLGLTLLFAVPPLLVFDGGIRLAVAVGVAVAVFYTGFRKRMPDWFGI
ncbi:MULTISPECIES: metal-dependent hydrolase [Haloferax]|uniref:Metal-dependent hydrolase n=1 Tax=Haloferax marinum TaxID=2666143 RepID=A0A6A8G8M1_9EURY|nr:MULTISPECIES: metal-dependent hydrolase [Haloferax]KAB1198259.1 metal-dependent hydrolase [Haloferax sp. CBA1150]MRW97351.1 metal-dependent hydrolase [Haloferax marinum]